MRFIFFIFLAFFPLISLAKDGVVTRTFKANYLPKSLAKIELGVSTKQDVINALGKPLKSEKSESLLFYDLAGHRFDTTIEIKNGKVHSIYFSLPLGTAKLKDIEKLLPPDLLTKALEGTTSKGPGHQAGQEVPLYLKDENLQITFKRSTNMSVQSFYQSL